MSYIDNKIDGVYNVSKASKKTFLKNVCQVEGVRSAFTGNLVYDMRALDACGGVNVMSYVPVFQVGLSLEENSILFRVLNVLECG